MRKFFKPFDPVLALRRALIFILAWSGVVFFILFTLAILLTLTGCATPTQTLQSINTDLNGYPYIPRPVPEPWKTPLQFYDLQARSGICIDYAIAKHALIPNSTILVGVLMPSKQGHAVLLTEDNYILDNRFDDILPYQTYIDTYHFHILYTTDGKHRWKH